MIKFMHNYFCGFKVYDSQNYKGFSDYIKTAIDSDAILRQWY